MNPIENNNEKFEWSIQVPIFRNPAILKQLGIAIGIPFGLLIIFLFLVSNDDNRIYSFYALGLIVVLFLLTYLFIMILYGGKYSVSFVVDENGILSFTQADQAKKNKIVNGLTVGLGLLSGKPGAAGAGMLADAKQSMQLKWKQVRKVKYEPNQQVILLRAGFTENIAVFCEQENYQQVEEFIKSKVKL